MMLSQKIRRRFKMTKYKTSKPAHFYNKKLYDLEQKWRQAQTEESRAWAEYCRERDKGKK